MPKYTASDPSKTVELYDRQLTAHPTIERKGAKNPYTSVNGHMFSATNRDGEIGIRLSKEEQAAFLEKFDAKLFISYGATMRGYVTVPVSLLKSDEFQEYLDNSYAYVSSLPPKATKKPKK